MAVKELYLTPLIHDPYLENYYRFDDLNDSSGKSRVLTDPGSSSVANTGGKFDKFAYGADWGLANNLNADTFSVGTNDITFGCWVLKNGAPTTDYTPEIMCIGNVNRLYLIATKTTGYANFLNYDGAATNCTLTTNVNICDNAWHLVVATRSGTAHKIYVDGVEVGSVTGTARTPGVNKVAIGNNHENTYDKIGTCGMDDAFVFSRALTATEIGNLYNGTWPSSNFFAFFL